MKNYLLLFTVFSCYIAMSQSVDYDTEIQPIFNNSCMPCHEGNNPSGGLNLTSYANVMNGSNSGAVIIPGDYQNSVLWQEVSSGDMPNMTANNWMGILDLTAEELALISTWITELAQTGIATNANKEKDIIKVFNTMGREVQKDIKDKTLIYLYDDGSVEKKYQIQ